MQAAVAFVGAIEEAGLYDLATTPVVRRKNRVLPCLSTGLLLSHACVIVCHRVSSCVVCGQARGGDIVERAPLAGGGLPEQGQRQGDLSRALAMAQAWPMLEWGGCVAGGVDGFWRWLTMESPAANEG